MTVDEARAAGSSEHWGQRYYFCGRSCLAKFEADPNRYLQHLETPQPAVESARQVEYTCPMHPEVRQPGPGSCPKCGMALEPLTISADEEPENAELKDMKRRFWISLVLTVPVLLIAMAGDWLAALASPRVWVWFELIVATPVVLCGG